MMALHRLDEKDIRILQELVEDSSQSITELASKLGMPRTTVQERVKRLRESGVIKKFTVKLDYSKLGKNATAFVLVSVNPEAKIHQKELAEMLAKLEDVVEVHVISGEWDFLLKIRGESVNSIGSLVVDKLRNIEGIGRTVTCVSFATFKEEI